MIRLQDICITLLGSIPLLVAMSSCVMEKYEDCPADPTPQEHWITLQFVMSGESAVTRANPMGGEDGNGREDGINNENKIHDVNIFLHTCATSLLNSYEPLPLTHLYFNLDNPTDPANTLNFEKEEPSDDNLKDNSKVIYTVKFKNPVQDPNNPLKDIGLTPKFITLANIGKSMKGEFANLEELRSHILPNQTWESTGVANVKGYDRFIMTSAYETNIESSLDLTPNNGSGSKEKPYFGSTTLERMCARIEVMYEKSNIKDDKSELIYSVKDETTELSSVHILNMLPVNIMSKPSFLFKKVTNGLPNDWNNVNGIEWGGREIVDEKDVPSNYVLEPFTLIKETLNGAELKAKMSELYGNTQTSAVAIRIQDASDGKVNEYYHGELRDKEFDKNTNMTILGYANENTQSPNQFNSNFITGIAFRAVYIPATIYGGFFDETDEEGKTEIKFIPIDDKVKPDTIYRYSPSNQSQLEKDCKYFSKGAVLKRYQASHPEDIAEVTFFTPEQHDGKWGFICYYNLWLRHYNDETADPQRDYPMEYATVRNNIYRVSISFNGPGDPSPTMREPDTMQARIFVRKWNYRKENKPLEF